MQKEGVPLDQMVFQGVRQISMYKTKQITRLCDHLHCWLHRRHPRIQMSREES